MYWKDLFKDCKMDLIDNFDAVVEVDRSDENSISFEIYSDNLEKYDYYQGVAIFEDIINRKILDMKLKTGDIVDVDVYMVTKEDYARIQGVDINKISKYDLIMVDIVSKKENK